MELLPIVLCPVLYSLKDSFEQALSRDDVKAIVITGNYLNI